MGRTKTLQKTKKPFKIEAKFMNWVLHHLPTNTDSSNEDDNEQSNYKTAAYVIHSDDSEMGLV